MKKPNIKNEGAGEHRKSPRLARLFLTMKTKHLRQQADRALRLAERCGDDDVARKLRTIAREYLEEAEQPPQVVVPFDLNLTKDRG